MRCGVFDRNAALCLLQRPPMHFLWLPSAPTLMVAVLVLFCGLFAYVLGILEFTPRFLRNHGVSYRRLALRLADLKLIIRLILKRG